MKTVAKAHKRLHTALAVFSVVAAGCASHPPSARSARTPVRPLEPASDATALVPATARRGDPCGVRSGEAKVGAQMIERGAALVFTTSDDVHELRQRVIDSTVLAPLRTVQPRFDNIHGGLRLVFETETAGDLAIVQRITRERAREIAKACGITLAAEGEWAAEQQREDSSTASPDSRASSEGSQDTPAARDKPKEPEADKSDTAKPPANADAKPEPAKQPKPEGEAKDSDKPKDDKIPKGDEKPPVPPLPGPQPDPGPRPDPIAPDRNG
jgi:hypothetical protein